MNFKVGDRVRRIDGPHEGATATVVNPNRVNSRGEKIIEIQFDDRDLISGTYRSYPHRLERIAPEDVEDSNFDMEV